MKERQRGIVVCVDGKHVKTVPRRYKDVVCDDSFITNPDQKRLTTMERLELESRRWISKLSWDQRYVKELIEGCRILRVWEVYDRFGDVSFQGEYSNGVMVIIPIHLYKMAPELAKNQKNSL